MTMLLGGFAFVTLLSTLALGLSLPPTREQGEVARLIAVHPPLAWAAYLSFGVTALASALWLWPRTRAPRWDHLAVASAEVGVVLTALTLATGSVWGRPTWGVWWTWDARLTLTALMLFLYLGYLALRRVPADADVRARRSAVTALLAVAVVPVNHFAVEWWRTLHQGRSLAQMTPRDSLDGDYVAVMLLGFLAMTLVYAWLVAVRYRIEQREEHVDAATLEQAIAERRAEAVAR
ncbi:MAG TPA: cytochrome c biogenesis protein CcsA [Acidimicrobiales bacterium]|nr:cytochrome c biogenesis protein CcsA [Acidimicrobiales bacterium]